MELKAKFEKPLSVSIGSKPDIMVIRFVEPELFISKETGKTLLPDFEIKKTIPKQFPDQDSFQMAVITATSVQMAANSAFMS